MVSSKHIIPPFLLSSDPVPARLIKMAPNWHAYILQSNLDAPPHLEASHRDNQGEKTKIVLNAKCK